MGFSNAFAGDTYAEFRERLVHLDKESRGEDLAEGRVPQTHFWITLDEKPIGWLKIRHYLNDYLREHGGHIGYGIVPTARGKGYGTEALRLGLEEAQKLGIDRVLLTCNPSNIGSRRVIEKNGGQLELETNDSCYYWIQLPPAESI